MKTKKCSKCLNIKDFEDFGVLKRSKDSRRGICKKCRNEKDREWIKNNPNKHKANQIRYIESNVEKVAQSKKNWKKRNSEKVISDRRRWRKNNPHYSKIRRNNDILFKVVDNLRSRFRQAFKRGFKTGSAIRDLGCSVSEFIKYLEYKFKPGMTWENYGEWHIDHIKPLSSFNLSDVRQAKLACHYTNLQPLWAEENLSKGNR